MAEGQANPIRRIEGQRSLLSRTMHGMGYNDIEDTILVPAQLSQSILTFRGDANGETPPLRVLQGPHTQIRQADRVTVDPIHKEMIVMDSGQVLVYPADANGDVAPIRVIKGSDTMFGGGGIPPIAVDPKNNVIIVAAQSILIFDRLANGNAKPLRVITGGTGGGRPAAVYDGLIFAGTRGGGVGVWSVNDNGAVNPRWTIGAGLLKQLRGVAIDAKHQEVIITDKELNVVLTYHVPEIFAPGAVTPNNRTAN
jgi:hypothetical protein